MTRPSPWTVAVADGMNPRNPSIAYVVDADDRTEAIARVHAHHSSVYGWAAERILTVAADPGVPTADAWHGWTDLRGIKALRLVVEPGQLRQLARLRLRLRRWNTMMTPYHAAEDKRGEEIPATAWHAYLDEAEALCEAFATILLIEHTGGRLPGDGPQRGQPVRPPPRPAANWCRPPAPARPSARPGHAGHSDGRERLPGGGRGRRTRGHQQLDRHLPGHRAHAPLGGRQRLVCDLADLAGRRALARRKRRLRARTTG